jgi:uncharacterized protein YigA (DUF484 family)
MTESSFSAHDIAAFLSEHPNFFEEHAEVFGALRVPTAHGAGTISLGERQILTLRERVRDLEWRLSQLVHNATANESTGDRLTRWTARLLAENNVQHIPGEIALGLAEIFDLADVALRVWRLPEAPETGFGAQTSDDVHTFADSLKAPYCGTDTGFEAVSWLNTKPQSLALVALRPEADAPSVGLLVLGSSDPERFTPDMGSAYLETIGALASAALHRLAGNPQSSGPLE